MENLRRLGFTLGIASLLAQPALTGQIAHAAPPEGDQFFINSVRSPVVDFIAQAKTALDIEIYEMEDSSVLTAIRSAMARGVRVRVIHEPNPVGGACEVFSSGGSVNANCENQRLLVTQLNARGRNYVPFNRPALCPSGSGSCLEHGKMMVADQARALISSGNFNSTNLCDLTSANPPAVCNRDYSYVTSDSSAVGTLQNVFNSDFAGQTYDMAKLLESPSSNPAAGRVTVSPASMGPLVGFIRSAKSSIQIQNQYLQDPTLNKELIDARARGVKVEAMIASLCSFNRPTPSETAKYNQIYGPLMRAGVQLKFFTKNMKISGLPGYLHAKAIVVDNARAWVGSVNGSTMALTRNREYGIFFSDAKLVSELASQMSADQAHCNAVDFAGSLSCAQDPRN